MLVNDNVAVERRGCAVVCMPGDEIPLRAFLDQARKQNTGMKILYLGNILAEKPILQGFYSNVKKVW